MNIFNSPSSSKFPLNNNPMWWVGLRDNDWSKVTPKVGLELIGLEPLSWFLSWGFSQLTKLTPHGSVCWNIQIGDEGFEHYLGSTCIEQNCIWAMFHSRP